MGRWQALEVEEKKQFQDEAQRLQAEYLQQLEQRLADESARRQQMHSSQVPYTLHPQP